MIFFFRFLLLSALFSISILAVLPDYNALPPLVSISDLLNHAAAFCTLTILYSLAYSHSLRRIILTLLGYGILIEIVQLFLPTRFASIEDIMADSVGLVTGIVAVKMIRSMMERKSIV